MTIVEKDYDKKSIEWNKLHSFIIEQQKKRQMFQLFEVDMKRIPSISNNNLLEVIKLSFKLRNFTTLELLINQQSEHNLEISYKFMFLGNDDLAIVSEFISDWENFFCILKH